MASNGVEMSENGRNPNPPCEPERNIFPVFFHSSHRNMAAALDERDSHSSDFFKLSLIQDDVHNVFSVGGGDWNCKTLRGKLAADAIGGSTDAHADCDYFSEQCFLKTGMLGCARLENGQKKDCTTKLYSTAADFITDMEQQWVEAGKIIKATTCRFTCYKWLNKAFGVGGRVRSSPSA